MNLFFWRKLKLEAPIPRVFIAHGEDALRLAELYDNACMLLPTNNYAKAKIILWTEIIRLFPEVADGSWDIDNKGKTTIKITECLK